MATNNVQLSKKKKVIEKENAFWNKEIKRVESCTFIEDSFKAKCILELNGRIKLLPQKE